MSPRIFALALLLTSAIHAPVVRAQQAAAQQATKESPAMHHASGSFEPGVKVLPADFPGTPALGRMTLNKQLHGGIEGVSTGEMLTATSETRGSAGYVAVEVVTGKVDGRSGSFSLDSPWIDGPWQADSHHHCCARLGDG